MDTPKQTDLSFIHRFIPGKDSGRAPLLLLHGSGGDEHDLLPLAERIGPGRAIVSPRGKTNEKGITRFFPRPADGAWDLGDLEQRTAELADFVRSARGAYGLPKPVVLGYSNGANISWSLLLPEPGASPGSILFPPMLPFGPRPLPDLRAFPVPLIAAHDD